MERVPDLPRVTERLLDAVVFIYRDEEQATNGLPEGGTGCLVSYPFKAQGLANHAHLYAVTNSHVAKRDGRNSVIRINKLDGRVQLVVIRGDDWTHHVDADIAVVPLDLDQQTLRLADIPIEIFVSQEDIASRYFTEGDECLFIGRHHGLDGLHRNTPAVRMGSVAVMQPEPIYREEFVRSEESIAVEARSLSGFSGSPVFVWQTESISAPAYLDKLRGGEHSLIGKWPVVLHGNIESRFAFLGITWGHMKGPNAVVDPGDNADEIEKALTLNSGIMLAVPAWKIKELLDCDELVAMREEAEDQEGEQAKERAAQAAAASRSVAVADSSESPDEGRVSLHPLPPEEALRAMLRTPPKDGD